MSSNIGIGKVKTSLTSADHTQMNCGIGLYDKDKVYYMADADGKIIVDGKKCTVLSKDGYDNIAVLTLGDKQYDVVKMPDEKYWLAQNLDYLPDGVTLITSDSEFVETSPICSYYKYTNDGRGLNYNVLAQNILVQYLPEDWHIATESDWMNLATSIGGNTVANLKKIRSTEHWPNTQGTDEFGLNIIPNGDERWDLPNGVYFPGGIAYIRMSNNNRIRISDTESFSISTIAGNILMPIRLVKD